MDDKDVLSSKGNGWSSSDEDYQYNSGSGEESVQPVSTESSEDHHGEFVPKDVMLSGSDSSSDETDLVLELPSSVKNPPGDNSEGHSNRYVEAF